MPINSGQMNQRIILQTRTAGVDALGQESTTWSDTMIIWAHAEPLRGREFFAAGQAQSEVDVRFRVRWRDTITPTMRVSWRDELYDIVSIIEPQGGREQLELMCSTAARDSR